MSKTKVFTIVLATLTVVAIGFASVTPDRPYVPTEDNTAHTPTR